jgi:membrane associated rhomboid family serine protease
MQIEIKPEDYEVVTSRQSKIVKYYQGLLVLSNRYGGYKLIIALCVFFYLVSLILLPTDSNIGSTLPQLGQESRSYTKGLTLWGTNIYQLIIPFGGYYRWITANYLHFGVIHLAFNVFGAYVLGNLLEKLWNAKHIFVLFLLSGIMANIATFFITKGNSAGASGGVFGLMGGVLGYFFFNRNIRTEVRAMMIKQIGYMLLINLVIGLVVPNIDLVGHLGGFVAGVGIARLYLLRGLFQNHFFLLICWVFGILLTFGAFIYATIVYL